MAALQLSAQALLVALGIGALKATVILLAAMGTAWSLRRASAGLRNLVWLAALAACLAVLFLPRVTPVWRVELAPAVNSSLSLHRAAGWISAAELADQRAADNWTARPASRPSGVVSAAASSPQTLSLPSWPVLLAGLWVLGAETVLIRQIVSLLVLRSLRRQSRPLVGPSAELAARLGAEMDVRAGIAVCDTLDSPLAFGAFDPWVLLPGSARGWGGQRLENVLRHELAHVQRRDAWAEWLASLCSAVLWFHPLVWHAARRLRHERELACDDLVLAGGIRPSAYAQDLLALAAGPGHAPGIEAALAMTGPSRIEQRLRALLSASNDRRAPSRRTAGVILCLSLAVAAPVAAMSLAPGAVTPSAAGLGGRIAVSLQRAGVWNLYLVSPDGSNLRALTSNTDSNRFPVWSPDGSRLLFGRNHLPASDNNWMEGWGLNVMRADGSQDTQLFPKVVAKAARVWSPDGTRIAFESNRDGDRELYVVRADGTGLTRLTISPGDDGSPAWSPDGGKIAFVSSRDGDKEIYVVPAQGGQARRLTNHPGDDEDPTWSPDGASIALISADKGQDQIAVMAADGSHLSRITADPTAKHLPHWSPNGQMILFQSVRGDNYDLERVEKNGAGRLRLTTAPGYDGQAGFSPDGRWVVMVSDGPGTVDPSRASSVYIVSVDGGPARLVAAGPALDAAWSPGASS